MLPVKSCESLVSELRGSGAVRGAAWTSEEVFAEREENASEDAQR